MNAEPLKIGKKRYRVYPVYFGNQPARELSRQKVSLLNEDDAESEEEQINVEAIDDEFMAGEDDLEEMIQNIFFDPNMRSYTLYTRLQSRGQFDVLFGPSGLLRAIESESTCVLIGNLDDFSIEIRGNSPSGVVKADCLVNTHCEKDPSLVAKEYTVINQKTRNVMEKIASGAPPPQSTPAKPSADVNLEEYPQINVNFERKSQRYFARIKNFPRAGASFLLGSGGTNLKSLKQKFYNRVDIYINRDKGFMDIRSAKEEDIREAYATFVRMIKEDTSLALRFEESSQDFTHFLGVNLESNPEILALQQECYQHIRASDVFATDANKFHMTLGMLTLTDTRKIISELNKIAPDLRKMGAPFQLGFDRIGFFGKSRNANVVSVEPREDNELERFRTMHCFLLKHLMGTNIIKQSELKRQKFSINGDRLKFHYHGTIFRGKGKGVDITALVARKTNFFIPFTVVSFEIFNRTKPSPPAPYPIEFSLSLLN